MGQRTKRRRRRSQGVTRRSKGPRPPKTATKTATKTARSNTVPHPAALDDETSAQRFAEMIDAAEGLDGNVLLDLALGACTATLHVATREPRCVALLEAVAEDLEEARYNGGYLLSPERLRGATAELGALLNDAEATDVVLAACATMTAGLAALAVIEDDLGRARHQAIVALQLARRALPERGLPGLLLLVDQFVTHTALLNGRLSHGHDPHASCPDCGGEGMNLLRYTS
jgi:hypothetical protein